MTTNTAMAKKPKKKTGPKPATPGVQREEIVAVRCREVWKDWLQRFAGKERSTPTNLIDKALADLAVKLGFEEPPER
jgi:hypothetical protein